MLRLAAGFYTAGKLQERGSSIMPELPEVETVVRSVRPWVTGRRITGVEVRLAEGPGGKAAFQVFRNTVQELRRALTGAVMEEVSRHGKTIVFRLRRAPGGAPRFLLVHLGMTGRLTCETFPEFRSQHTYLVLGLDAPGRWLHYADTRRFGRIRVAASLPSDLAALGPEPLEVSFEEFFRRLGCRRAMLKSLLLDQRFLRGLGNIYADESLFRAGLHPASLGSRLTRAQALALHRAIRETLRLAIKEGGSSISDYADAEGRAGRFQFLHQVYQRTGEPCFRCGTPIRRMVIASRSTHFCPRCQRRGRGAGRRETVVEKGGRAVETVLGGR